MNETQEQIRPAPQAGKTAIQLPSHLRLVRGGAIGQMGFDIPVTVFFRVEFRRVLGQRFDNDFRMIPQVADCLFTRMDGRLITDQEEAFRHEPAQVLQGDNHVLTLQAAFEIAFVNLARQGQPHRRAQGPSLPGDPSDHRTLATWRPRAPEPFLKRVAELIKKHDVYAAPPRFF